MCGSSLRQRRVDAADDTVERATRVAVGEVVSRGVAATGTEWADGFLWWRAPTPIQPRGCPRRRVAWLASTGLGTAIKTGVSAGSLLGGKPVRDEQSPMA